LQAFFHTVFKWANWIFIIAIVIVVFAFLTPPIVRELLGSIATFIIAIFVEVGLPILRFAGRVINSLTPGDIFG
jgi:hypothetical protein